MSQIDSDLIWGSLGTFFDLFPVEERVYWQTFWEAYSDIVGDLWGAAVQVDRAKSLYATRETIARRDVRIELSNLNMARDARFRLSMVKNLNGTWIMRGFVPRDLRDFKVKDIAAQGTLRIGVDILDYTSVNLSAVSGGVFDGFVQEAVFTLSSEPPHDYADDPEFSDDFNPQPQNVVTRIIHVPGDTVVDAVLVSSLQPVSPNKTGVLVLGVSGVNLDIVEYQSYVVIADRYVFTLAPGQSLGSSHGQDEFVAIHRYDSTRWSQNGNGRVASRGAATLILESGFASEISMANAFPLSSNTDFDVGVSVSPLTWGTPGAGVDGHRQALARLGVGGVGYVAGLRTTRFLSVDSQALVSGLESAPTLTPLTVVPEAAEIRFSRIGSTLEILYRDQDDSDWRLLSSLPVTGESANLSLSAENTGLSVATRMNFDEVIRRQGSVVGNVRLEEFFTATTARPFTYDCDQVISSAPGLGDRPRLRVDDLELVDDVVDSEQTSLRARGVITPVAAGTLRIGDLVTAYDRVTSRGSGVFEFQLRTKIDPDFLPLTAGTALTSETRKLIQDRDYAFDGLGHVSFRELPTRLSQWAETAEVDYRHVQSHFGVLLDLDNTKSTLQYLTQARGTWFALMSGPSRGNVYSGLQMAMGLPVARVDGTVDSISEFRDDLGRVIRRVLTIVNENGSFEHELSPQIPFIDWTVAAGARVNRFQPLTTGVEVLDYQTDPLWHERFSGVNEVERFNTFGVFVALEALTAESSVGEAVRFALRIKPTYTKLVMRFVLTTSGYEDISDEIDDDVFAIHRPHLCDDISFDEGEPPEDPSETLRLGDGHKLGQGKHLGPQGNWQFLGLGEYVVVSSHPGDGSWTTAPVTVDIDPGAPVVLVSNGKFTSAGSHVFTSADVGRLIRISSGADAGEWKILSVISATEVLVEHLFTSASLSVSWQLIDRLSLGEGWTLGLARSFQCLPAGGNVPTEFLGLEQIVTMTMPP